MSTSLFLDHPQLKTSVFLNTLGQFISTFFICLNFASYLPSAGALRSSQHVPSLQLPVGVYRQYTRIVLGGGISRSVTLFCLGFVLTLLPSLFCPCTVPSPTLPCYSPERLRLETEIYSHCPQLTKCVLSFSCSLCFFLFNSFLYRRGLVCAGHHTGRSVFFSLI